MSERLTSEEREGLVWFFSQIPFNQHLQMTAHWDDEDHVRFEIPMQPQLIGNAVHGILHGGVVATALDVSGGCMAAVGTLKRTRDMPTAERMAILSRIGTIDMRVDYLLPGRGGSFTAKAELLRIGNKVAVTRMSMWNDAQETIAVGTGTYLCG